MAGAVQLKKTQDDSLPIEMHYIRKIIVMTEFITHEEDEPALIGDSDGVQIIICMTPEGSKHLLCAQYLQSDMAFKRIVGFFEFEMAAVDRISNTSKSLCSSPSLCSSLPNILRIYRYHLLPCICDSTNCCSA